MYNLTDDRERMSVLEFFGRLIPLVSFGLLYSTILFEAGTLNSLDAKLIEFYTFSDLANASIRLIPDIVQFIFGQAWYFTPYAVLPFTFSIMWPDASKVENFKQLRFWKTLTSFTFFFLPPVALSAHYYLFSQSDLLLPKYLLLATLATGTVITVATYKSTKAQPNLHKAKATPPSLQTDYQMPLYWHAFLACVAMFFIGFIAYVVGHDQTLTKLHNTQHGQSLKYDNEIYALIKPLERGTLLLTETGRIRFVSNQSPLIYESSFDFAANTKTNICSVFSAFCDATESATKPRFAKECKMFGYIWCVMREPKSTEEEGK